MKRSSLKRKTPLRASNSPGKPRKRLPAKRATERRSSRVRDEEYLAWCRQQPCMVREFFASIPRAADGSRAQNIDEAIEAVLVERLEAHGGGCWGPTDPEHERSGGAEGPGMGQKASDRRAWPCCRGHHDQRHNTASGIFKGWGRAKLDAFIRERIAEANARYDAERASKAAS